MQFSIHDQRRRPSHALPASFAAVLLMALALNGCGGSSGAGVSTGGGTSSGGSPIMTNSGPFTFTASIALPPVTMGGRNAAVVGFAGGTITSATAKLPPPSSTNLTAALANTLIAYDDDGQTKIFNYGTDAIYPIGEGIGTTFSTSPSFSGVGNRLAVAQRDSNSVAQTFVESLDGSSKVAIGRASGSVNPSPAYSPDGSKIAFLCLDSAGKKRLALVPAGGGSTTFITDGTDNPANPVWSPDGTKVVYVDQLAGSDRWSPMTFAVSSGGVPIPLGVSPPGTAPFITFLGGDPGDLVESYNFSGTTFTERFRNGSRVVLSENADIVNGISGSPIGKFLLIGDSTTNTINLLNADAPTLTPTPLIAGNGLVRSPNWGPYLTSKTLIGSGGAFGVSAGAILYGAAGSTVGGIVSVDAVTKSSISVQPQGNSNPTQSIIFATVTGTNLTSFKYMNGLNGAVVTVFSGTSPGVSGALVSFDADTGNVLSVVTYGASLAKANGVYTGKILSAFDATGKNVAPNGARRVAFDTNSGKLLSVN